MPGEDSLYPADWVRIAEKDLERAERLLEEDAQLAGFCLQQAVEKFLKAFLLARGWRFRRIHDLVALLADAIAHDPSLEQSRDACRKITEFYTAERYPHVVESGVAEEDVRTSLEQATALIAKLREGATNK